MALEKECSRSFPPFSYKFLFTYSHSPKFTVVCKRGCVWLGKMFAFTWFSFFNATICYMPFHSSTPKFSFVVFYSNVTFFLGCLTMIKMSIQWVLTGRPFHRQTKGGIFITFRKIIPAYSFNVYTTAALYV